MGSRLRVRQRHFRDPLTTGRRVDGSVVAQNAAVSVIRVGAETNVDREEQTGKCLAQERQHLDHGRRESVGLGPARILCRFGRDAEDEDGLELVIFDERSEMRQKGLTTETLHAYREDLFSGYSRDQSSESRGLDCLARLKGQTISRVFRCVVYSLFSR